LIEIDQVSRVYQRGADEIHALERVSLHVPKGASSR
jgi:ABC-type methionine transport system ATPase subunit